MGSMQWYWEMTREETTMEDFYRWQRRRTGYLMDGDEPVYSSNLNAFISLPGTKMNRTMLERENISFQASDDEILAVHSPEFVNAVKRAYGLRNVPTPDRLTRIGEPWRPYRSVACWYLWASLDNVPAVE